MGIEQASEPRRGHARDRRNPGQELSPGQSLPTRQSLSKGQGLSAAQLRGLPEGTVVGYAAGAFDLFHVGHLNILRQAKAHCDYLIAGVVSDEMLQLTKGRAPVVPSAERAEIVSHVRFVDEVHVESVEDKLETWEHVRFDLFFKGDDWKGTPRGADLERRFREVGVDVVYFPYTVHTSSTRLRAALDLLSAPKPLDNGAHKRS